MTRATAVPQLSPAIRAALDAPAPGRPARTPAGGRAWASVSWGDPADPPMLLIHGVTSDAGTFWRLGPALAAAGRFVVAVDLPGHGGTGSWRGEHRFVETARDVIGFVRAADLDRPGLAVLGHSWGGMVTAALPAAGLRPATLVLLEAPAMPVSVMAAMTRDPDEQPGPDVESTMRRLAAAHPEWAEGDARAKAEGLARFDREAVRAVLFDNGDWDAGLASLADPAANGVPAWLIRGSFEWGGLIPDAAVPAIAARIGADHVITIANAPHSPQRTHIEHLVEAVLRAIA
ncbi:MAG TPA: alpha/beta fold hydrolase [Candidatus Limnocylindrales bacterium]